MSVAHVVLMGPPGAGKGTQAIAIMRDCQLEHLSTGDVLRAEVINKTPLGLNAQEYMNRGALVPDQLVIDMVAAVIKRGAKLKGFLLDGFPRSTTQAVALDNLLKERGESISHVVNLNVPVQTLLSRVSLRADTETPRSDDKQEVLKARLQVYEQNTKPLLDYYRGQKKLSVVNGDQAREKVFADIKKALGTSQ